MSKMNPPETMIEVVDLHKRFKDLHVLKGISTVVKHSEVVAVMGPSGPGIRAPKDQRGDDHEVADCVQGERGGETDADALTGLVRRSIDAEPRARLEYVELVDGSTLTEEQVRAIAEQLDDAATHAAVVAERGRHRARPEVGLPAESVPGAHDHDQSPTASDGPRPRATGRWSRSSPPTEWPTWRWRTPG